MAEGRRPAFRERPESMAEKPFGSVTTLTFDCYGTLIDWETGILAELRPWAARHGLEVADDALLEAFAAEESACEAEMPSAPYPEILEAVHRRLAGRFGAPPSGEDARAFAGSVGRWPAFPDSPPALDALRRHYRLVVISNVDRRSFAESRARLGVDFDRVITAEEMGFYKPDPRAFAYLTKELEAAFGTDPSEILHVAQSLHHDILPASEAGLRTVWVNRRTGSAGWGATPPPARPVEPDREVTSMAEVASLLVR